MKSTKTKTLRVTLQSQDVGFTGALPSKKYPRARTNHGTNLLHGLLRSGVSFDKAMKVALGVEESNSWDGAEPQYNKVNVPQGTRGGRGSSIIEIPAQPIP